MKVNPVARAVTLGAALVLSLFFLGIALLIRLDTKYASLQFRDIGVVFGAAIAATGAITAAFIAFQASHHLESERDRRERRRIMDEERTRTEAAIVTLHVAATYMDGIYLQIRKATDQAEYALQRKNYLAYRDAVLGLPDVPNPFPLIKDLDVRFMRLQEQTGVRGIQVCLELVEGSVRAVKTSVREQERRLSSGGEATLEGVLSFHCHQVMEQNERFLEAILPYINQRGAGVVPDESKLSMLLGDLAAEDKTAVTSLNDARESIRKVVSRLLYEHVHAKDLRSLLQTVAEGIKDEDSIPFKAISEHVEKSK